MIRITIRIAMFHVKQWKNEWVRVPRWASMGLGSLRSDRARYEWFATGYCNATIKP